MKLSITFFFIFLLIPYFLNAQNVIDTVEITSFLQKKYDFKSMVEIIEYHNNNDKESTCVFKILNTNTKLHKRLKSKYKATFKKSEIHKFNTLYRNFFIPEHFLKIFVPIYKLQGKYYLYQPCDFQSPFMVTNTYYAPEYMDGVYAYPIVEYIKLHINKISITTSVDVQEYMLELIDGVNFIYRLQNNDNFVGYFTTLDNVANLQIIAEDCYNKGTLFKHNFEQE